MKYEEAMKYITEVGNFGSNYGLERTYKLLEHLGNPERDLKLIHIAGTIRSIMRILMERLL